MLTRHRSFCSQLRHLCNSVASSFPSGSRKFLFELQQLMIKADDFSPSTSAAAPSAALAGTVAAPATSLHSFTKPQTPPFGPHSMLPQHPKPLDTDLLCIALALSATMALGLVITPLLPLLLWG